MLKHLDLFSGIGGFSLAARWTGAIETVQFVELDPFCQQVLRKNFGEIPIHGDIRTFSAKPLYGAVDLVTGGFPCQDLSVAGQRKGFQGDRSSLWFEMLRVIRECQPAWVIVENVTGLLSLGIEICLAGLEAEGYETETFVLPACGVNAPHRRNRVWIVAHCKKRENHQRNVRRVEHAPSSRQSSNAASCVGDSDAPAGGVAISRGQQRNAWRRTGAKPQNGYCQLEESALDANGGVFKGFEHTESASRFWLPKSELPDWSKHWFEVAAALCRVDDGLPRGMDRRARLKALGNAIVPQVVFPLLNTIVTINAKDFEKGFEPLWDY